MGIRLQNKPQPLVFIKHHPISTWKEMVRSSCRLMVALEVCRRTSLTAMPRSGTPGAPSRTMRRLYDCLSAEHAITSVPCVHSFVHRLVQGPAEPLLVRQWLPSGHLGDAPVFQEVVRVKEPPATGKCPRATVVLPDPARPQRMTIIEEGGRFPSEGGVGPSSNESCLALVLWV